MKISRVVSAWFALLAIAFANGAFREMALVPTLGSLRAHQLSTLLLCAAILALSWLVILWIRPATPRDAFRIGAVWVVLTLIFEFGFGRARGTPWPVLFADYNVFAGRIWPLVPIVTFLAPPIAARVRRRRLR